MPKTHDNELEQTHRDPTEMSRILCISEMELRRLTTAGILIRSLRKRHGRQRVVYELELNVMRYIGHLGQPAQHAREEYMQEKRFTQQIVREHKQLELSIARGDMIRRSRVVRVMTGLLSQIKNHVLGLPARCARQLIAQRDPLKIRAVLDFECRNTLREASNFGAHSFDETSTNGAEHLDRDGLERITKRVSKRRRKAR